MNHNYMNYFNPGSSGGMSGVGGGSGTGNNNGLDYSNQSNFVGANMPSTGGSFMDMINSGGPPPMMNTPGQQMARYNHPYNNMYGSAGYAMESSAARLQQFARQMAPRHTGYNYSAQNSPEQMSQYYMQKMQMRMAQINSFHSQRYNNPIRMQSGWPRMMPDMPPHLPQLSAQQNRMNNMVANQNFLNSDLSPPLRMNNMQNITQQQPATMRKMPVLDEAPLSLREQAPFAQQSSGFNTQFGNQAFSSTLNNSIDTMTYSNTSSSLDINSTDNLPLSNITFQSSPRQKRQQPSQQLQQQPQQMQQPPQQLQQPPQPLQQQSQQLQQSPQQLQQASQQMQPAQQQSPNFLSSFAAELTAPLVVPQSPKLTHFGPSPGSVSSASSFEQPQLSTQQPSQIKPLPQQQQLPSPAPSITPATQTLSYTSSSPFSAQISQQNMPMSPLNSVEVSKPPQLSNNANMQQYFSKMANIQQQISQLKQGIQTPETSSQIAMLNQQYQIIFKQYEASKQQFKPTGLYNQNTKQIQQQMMSQSSPSPLSLTNVTSRLQQQSLKMQPPPLQQEKPQLIHQQQQQLSQQLPTIPQQQPMHNLSQHQLPQYQQAMQQMPNLQSSGIPKQPRQLRAQLPQQQQRQPNLNSFKTEPPTLSEVKPSPLDNISNSVLLDDIGDGLNIPDLDSFSKDFDTKSSSLFSAAIFGGSDILFGGDSLDVGTGIKSEDSKENTITPLQSFKNEESKSFQELSSTTTVLSSGDQKNSLHRNVMNNDSVFPMQQQSTLGQVFQTMTTPPKQQNSFPFPFNPNQFSNQPGNYPQIPQNILNSMSDLLNKNIPPSTNSNIGMPMLPGKPGMSSLPGMSTSSLPEPTKQKASKTKNKSGKGSGKAGGKGKAGRPLGSLNKKKKEGKAKKLPIELEPDDFDHIPPGEQLLNDFDESSMDPSLKRSLRERTKKKNYKDDFDYNLSEDEDGKKADLSKDSNTTEGETPVVPEPVITGGANQLLAYRPNLEAEGEIAIIEKILAMRSLQKEEVKEEEMETMVDEFFVKYKGYSYLHCEWGTVEQLAKKDKRVHAKVKRYKQKRDTSFAILNELDDEPFNPDYIEIDRVLDMQTTFDPVTQENINHFLVKWRALPYEDSTWELQMNIDESIIRHFHELKKPPPEEQRKFIPRPHESEWQKLNESPEYKNGNQLRDYQLEGLNWLTFCWHKRINCILADEMGLGKTVQSISLLCAMKKYGIAGPFLVIAPLSTIGNWQREFEEWTDINAIVYHGSLNSRNCIQQYEMHYKDENNENISQLYKFEAIITTYEIVLSANSFLCTIPFRCLIIDEAHRLKNQKCKLMEGLNNLKMEHRVLLTGTPLQNNVEELFSLLNFLEPTRFPSQGAFMYEFGNLKTEAQVDKLKQILKPMMLRRLKEDVETNIASKEETIVEVELTTIQKKFYRAILERNFSFLAKGAGYSNLPNLMNTMMELRKCCNHPFLIKGAEDKIVSEYLTGPDDPDKPIKQMKALIESSGKMVLIDKLLPKLKDGGHKVLVFSQMIKVLNLIEDYLLSKRYPFERIDGGVQGNMRQAAIDRFCRPDSDRFVFLLCTRAGGLGINLTAADTVIIFDSDWNPQNDLQAQARCHRIGQNKPVKVYRLICRNTYEREMFDRASLKLGLDKAVLQNINAKEGSSAGQQSMSKKEVEDLLKKGAYGAVMETDEDANKFCEEDIDQILQRRTQIIQIKGEGKGSTFSKASFVSDKAGIDVDLEDPDFWKKWAQKASVDINELEKTSDYTGDNRILLISNNIMSLHDVFPSDNVRKDKKLIVDEPRKRKQTRRFGNDTDATVEMSDLDSDDETYEPYKTKKSANLGPIERAAWTRVECFKVEKLLLVYGWGRWQELISHAHFRQEVRHNDVEAISRTILAYCFRYYKTDEKSKQFFIDTIDESVKNAPPKNEKFDITNQILGSAPPPKSTRGRKRGGGNPGRNALRRLTHQYSKPALVECGIDWQTIDPEQLIIDAGYRKHLQHHCSKIMSRVRFLHSLQQDIIKEAATPILEGKPHAEIEISIPAMEGELPTIWWDEAADKSLLIGVFKHGYEKYRLIRNDPCLHFYDKLGPLQFNEKVPGSPDSIVNPSSIERSEDVASDSESVSSLKKKGKTKKDGDDEDSSIDSDEEKDIYSLNTSPASIVSTKEIVPACDIKLSNNPDTRWPLTTDLNTRLRRLFAAFTRSCEKEHNENIKAERDKIKQVRLANMVQERQRKKLEMQQRWTRREESDFYRVLSNFGVVTNLETKRYNWDKFRQLAKLDKKYDETLTAYYEDFTAMCRKICGRATSEDLRKLNGSQIEEISDDRASKLIQRIKLLKKIREEVLVHDKLKERLELCQLSIDLPRWWKSGKHDKALLDGVAKHGLGRTEYQVLLDPDSVFKELVDKIQRPSKIKSESTSSDSSHGLLMNGEHPLGGELPTTAKKISVDSSDENGGRLSSEFKMVVPMHTNEYAQLLSSWPKEKGIVTHLDKICSCVLKGEWPKPPKMETNPMVTKLPAFTRPLVSTVGHFTSAELTTEKSDGIRGEMVANRDFKVKSIDGLKLTVKTDNRIIKTDNSKKRKRKLEAEQGSTNEDSGLQTASGKTTKVNNEPRDPNKSDDVKPLQKKKVEEMCDKETSNKIPSSSIQIHIPKSGNTTVNTTSVSTKSSSNPIIYIPSTVKIPKVSAIIVSSLSNKLKTSNASSRAIVNTVSVLKTTGTRLTSDRKPTVVKVMNDKTLRLKKSTPAADVKIPSKGSDQPVGIHINSPNANVRIQGSKIEVKEKPTNVKREIDLTEVILKVPDPSRFLTKETKKKTVKPVKPFSKPLILPPDENKYSSVPAKPCDHKREVNNKPSTNLKEKKPNVPPPTTSTSGPELRRRPERTAKKRAKDSISEITEAEHRPIDKGELRETLSTPLSPPRREWREIHSPPPQRLAHSREHYVDYYPDRSPSRRSPDIHRYPPPRSPPVHYRLMSPERRSPPLHAIQGRPLSPLRHRHSHSPTPPPPRHIHSPLMREHEEHVKHLHYTEPLSPRYRAGERESPYFYSERSHSPYYYDYRHDKDRFYDELERRSPPLKHRRLASPVREIISPGSHKHGGFIHVPSEVMSPGNHRPPSHTQRELHSPNIKEGRFPYGRVDWDKSRYRHENVNSPPMRSSPVESQFQYQPLSRSIPKEDASSRKNIKSPFSQRDRVEHRSTSRDSLPSHRDDYTNLNISSHDSRHTVPEIRRTGLSPNETRLSVVSQQDVRRSVVSSPRNTRRNTITSQETRKTVISPQEKPRLVVSPHEARRNVISPHETRRQTVVSPYDVRNTTQCPNRRVSKETPPLPKSYSPPPAKSTTSHQSKESRTEHSLETAAKKTKLVERPVIEIPEETVRMSIERKTPATRKKGILEMKIQGLKSKMQQSGISEKIKEKMDAATATTAPASTSELPPKNRNSNNSRSGQTREQPMRVIKSLSDVINSLSNNEKNKVRSLPPETNSKPALELYSPKPSKRTKSLADITSTLAKSLEKSQGTVDSGPKDRPEKPVGRTRSSISMSEGEKNIVTSAKAKPFSSSKLSDVISNLKEKSKAASSALPESKYKAISLSSRPANDSKLMDMLKQSAVSRPLRSKSQFSSVTGDETVKTTNTSKQEIDTRNSPEETYTTRPAQNIIVRSPRTRRSSREERRLASPEVANAQRVTSPRFVKSQSTRTRSPSDLKSPTQLVSLSDGKLLQVTPSSSGKSNRMGAQSDVKSPFAGKSTSRVTSPTAVRSSPQVISPFEVTSPKSPVIPGNVATNTRKLPTTDSILASKMGSERALSPLKSIDVTNVNESECPSPTMPFIEETCGKVESPTAHVMLPVISVPVLRNTPSRRSSLTSPPPLIKSPPPLIKSPTLVRSPEMKSPTNRISPLSTLPLSRTTSLNREEVKGSPHLLHRTTPDPSSLQKIGSAKVPSLVKIPSPNPETSSIANSPVYEKTLQTPKHEELDPRSPEYPRSPPIISTHITSTTLVKPTAVIPKLSVDTKPLGLKDSNNLKLSCTSDSIVPHIMSKETRTSSEGKSDYMLQTNHEPSISTENKLEIDAGTEKVSFNPHKPISKQVTKKQSNEHCSIVVNANTKPIKDRNPEKINKTNTQNEMGAVITAKHSAPEERITVSVELSSAVENTKDNCSETREKKTIIPDKSSVCTETTNTRADESSSSMETKTATLEGHSFNTLSKTTNDYTRSTSTESNQICDSAAANTKTKAIIMETQSVYTELKSTDANASAPIEPTKTEKNTEVTGRKSPELQSFTKKN